MNFHAPIPSEEQVMLRDAAAGWVRDVNGTWTNMPIATGNGMNL